MSTIDRRAFLAKLANALRNGPLTARRLKTQRESVIWLIGPPGPTLQKYVEQLANICDDGPDVWDKPENANVIGTWAWAHARALEQPLVFDDLPLQGDPFSPAASRMSGAARWVGLTLIWE